MTDLKIAHDTRKRREVPPFRKRRERVGHPDYENRGGAKARALLMRDA